MEYKVYCDDAAKLINTIFICFKKKDKDGNRVKVDPQGVEIITWNYTTTDHKREVLIHTTQQWEEVGNIHLDASKDNDYIIASFYYWSEWTKNNKKGNEEAYYLGRFSEIILVHFYPQIGKVIVEL